MFSAKTQKVESILRPTEYFRIRSDDNKVLNTLVKKQAMKKKYVEMKCERNFQSEI